MANRRCILLHNLSRRHYTTAIFSSSNPKSLKTLNPSPQQNLTLPNYIPPQLFTPKSNHIPIFHPHYTPTSHFYSSRTHNSDNKDDNEDEEEEEEEDEDEEVAGFDDDDDEIVSPSNSGAVKRVYTAEEKEEAAAAIGYKVIGPLQRSDRVFKPYEPVFAVVQIGSHQFKVQTIIGRPILPDAAVHAVVEEHALDAKVIIFKKKRRKNYRRTKGHRQELTKLRITDIHGIEKPEMPAAGKPEKVAVKKPEKVAVAA